MTKFHEIYQYNSIVTIRKIHFIIRKIFDKDFAKNVSNYESIFDVLRIKFWFFLWKSYSHTKYTFSDHIANITCFRNFVFWFFWSMSCFFFLNLTSYFRFFLFCSLFFIRFFVCFFLTFLHVSWSHQNFFLFDFFVVFDSVDVEKMKSFWIWCETNHWLYIWFERVVCDDSEIASKLYIFFKNDENIKRSMNFDSMTTTTNKNSLNSYSWSENKNVFSSSMTVIWRDD